jgi:endonuclease/exonuclease/phosphatase family metal-dependent hydrolase
MDLRALTFNIRYDTPKDGLNAWPLRRQKAIDLVRAQSCNVMGFQEVLPRQRADLQAGLPEFTWIGHGRDADEGGEQCCMAIDPVFSLRDSGTFWLSPTPDVPGVVGWDAQLTRICTWAALARDGVLFTVLNAHWDHVGEMARRESARLLFERVMSVPEPVLLMGDFNTTPDSAPLQLLTSALQDTYGDTHPGSQAPTFQGFGQVPDGPRIDYLLASPEFLIVESRIVDQPEGPYPSDHFPVFGRYELLP